LRTWRSQAAPLFGIAQSNGGKVVIFGGGLPIAIGATIIGAVGTSAGTVEQDIAVAEAAAAAINDTQAIGKGRTT
jgi:uncharacterized protein GlcG (DUF336 family)